MFDPDSRNHNNATESSCANGASRLVACLPSWFRNIRQLVGGAAAAMAKRCSVEGEALGSGEDYAGGDAGFSIIEVLVVVVIMGCLASQVCPRVFGVLGHAKQQITKTDIANISGALDLYKLDVGSYPTTSQGLSALLAKPAGLDTWNGPYTQNKTLMDPWQQPWIYRLGSSEGQHAYDLCSSGGADAGENDKSKAICNS